MIAGTELNWDLTGLDIQKGPAERFPVSLPLSYRATQRLSGTGFAPRLQSFDFGQ
jgi:hypothetical protein